MEIIIRIIKKYLINEQKDTKQFNSINILLGLDRLRIISFSLIILSFYYFYSDFISFKGIEYGAYWSVLLFIHICVFSVSIINLIFYKRLRSIASTSLLPKVMIRCYIFLGVFLSVLTSVNSQRLTGNIDVYIIVVLILAMAFPFDPWFMYITYMVNHVLFIIGLTILDKNLYLRITNQINSTAAVAASVIFAFALNKFRVVDFSNKNKLKENELNFRRLFDASPLPLLVISLENYNIIYGNSRAFRFYAFHLEEYNKLNVKMLFSDFDEWMSIQNELYKMGRIQNHIVEHKLLTGQKIWVIANYEIIDYYNQKAVLLSVTDITQLKKMETELSLHASTDFLTGVINRRGGIQFLENTMLLAKQKKSNFVLCFADVNGLKIVNDKYGHSEGDFLIMKICDEIKAGIGPEDIIFRYGGDEFVIIFNNKSLNEAQILINQIKKRFMELNNQKYKPYLIEASMGLSEYRYDHDMTLNDLFKAADKEMYAEKARLRLIKN